MKPTDNKETTKALTYQHSSITRTKREALHQHKSFIVWFTGLSGSGKTTLAHAVEEHLHNMSLSTFVLDGDNIRHGLCNDLGFNALSRIENVRRAGEVAKLMTEAGIVTLTSMISPFKSDRSIARSLVSTGDFVEIYCKCPVEICELRDVKGLYKKARAGEISSFTGIDSPYEEPEHPELVLDTHKKTQDECVKLIIDKLLSLGLIKSI